MQDQVVISFDEHSVAMQNIGDLRRAIAGLPDDTPLVVFSSEGLGPNEEGTDFEDSDDVRCHFVRQIGTGWNFGKPNDCFGIEIYRNGYCDK